MSNMNSAAFNVSISPSFSSHAGTSWGGTVANWEGRILRVNGAVMANEVIFNCQKCENYKTSPRNVWTWNLLGDWNLYYEEAGIQQVRMKSPYDQKISKGLKYNGRPAPFTGPPTVDLMMKHPALEHPFVLNENHCVTVLQPQYWWPLCDVRSHMIHW